MDGLSEICYDYCSFVNNGIEIFRVITGGSA